MGCHPSGCEPPFQICFAAARAAGFLNLQAGSRKPSVLVRAPEPLFLNWPEIEYSAMTAEKRLRAPIFKGIRDDLMAPRKGPKRSQTPKASSSPVPKSNILQLLPDAVVPSRDQLIRYWKTCNRRAIRVGRN